jgi:hypothetical protein
MTASVLSTDTIRADRSSIREIVCGLRRDLFSRYQITVLKGFIDDSGSGGDSKWYVLAGYIGTVEGWDQFDRMWLDVLHDYPRAEIFKAASAESRKGPFAGFTVEQRNKKIDRLIEVIGKCTRRAVCARIRQRDYDDIVKGKVPPVFDSPYYFLFPIVMGAAVNIERIDGRTESIDFVFDDDETHDKGVKRLLPAVSGMQSFHGCVANIMRRDDEKFLPLQAADLLAWQIRRFLCMTNEPRRAHYDAAMNFPPERPHSFIMDRKMVQEAFNELIKGASEMFISKLAAAMGPKEFDEFLDRLKRLRARLP